MTERFILCMKYGRAYPADYANVLYNACRKALARSARFICLTDDAAGLDPGIEALPIPDVGLRPEDWFRGGVWPKIALFDRHFHGLRGRALFIDLDMVIVGDLDAFLDHPGRFVGINVSHGWGRNDQSGEAPRFGSGLFAYDLGAEAEIAETFRADPQAVMDRLRQEQQFVHQMRPDATFWPSGWVGSFKRLLRQPIGLDLILPPKPPGGETKVLAFHGRPRPIDLIRGKPYFWDRFPHLGHGRVRWMAEYWTQNGGRMPE